MTAFVRESALLTYRSLRALPRVPQRLLDVTIQPIMFVLLFLYVFGSAIHIHGISYKNYLFPGIIAQSLAFGVIGTAVATANDMNEGVVDRFRSMPISRLAIITGQVLGQLAEQILGLVITIAVGLLFGWTPTPDFGQLLELIGLIALALLAFTWTGVFFGMWVRSPDAVQGVGFIFIFPLSFLGGTFVPIKGLDLIPRVIAEWDPISAFVAAVRDLCQHYPSGGGSLMLDHAELSMALWSVLLLAIFVPLGLRRFNNTLAQ